jgi:hypothetical protein
VSKQLNYYKIIHYKKDSTLTALSIDNSDDLWKIDINISCHNLNLKNFWGGEWLSKWQVTWAPGSETFSIKGEIGVAAHAFEQGNF